MGSKVVFTAIVNDIDIEPDTPIKKDICINCNICVNQCQVNALDEKNKTNVGKCVLNSQPYGVHGNIQFLTKFAEKSQKEQKNASRGKIQEIISSLALGSQYVCFNCTKNCPAGQ